MMSFFLEIGSVEKAFFCFLEAEDGVFYGVFNLFHVMFDK